MASPRTNALAVRPVHPVRISRVGLWPTFSLCTMLSGSHRVFEVDGLLGGMAASSSEMRILAGVASPAFARATLTVIYKENTMKNKLPLKIYCFISNFLGTLLLIYGGISYIALFFMHTNPAGTIRTILQLPDILFLGLLLLGVSRFLRYVSGQTDRPGWILRKGEFIIYFAIIIKITQAIWGFSTVGAVCFGSSCSLSAKSFVVIIGVTMVFIRILIMFGIAQSLRVLKLSSLKKIG